MHYGGKIHIPNCKYKKIKNKKYSVKKTNKQKNEVPTFGNFKNYFQH